MNPKDLKKLETYKSEIARLERAIQKQNRKLAALPGKYGFGSMGDFIDALKAAGPARGGKRKASKAAKGGGRRKKRVAITDDMKAKVKSLVGAGKTGGEIAKSVGISLPSVQNIKKELGLVKKRK